LVVSYNYSSVISGGQF